MSDDESKDLYLEKERLKMVENIRSRQIRDQRVLDVMAKIERHLFIPEQYRDKTNPYGDHPCSIGHNQTISQPYITAYMTEKLEVKEGDRVLEVGTGSGYQSAILSSLGAQVHSIELINELADHARAVLADQEISNVRLYSGDGYRGIEEAAPFDAIIATCAAADIPSALQTQLKEGGRMILPIGASSQKLVMVKKRAGKIYKEDGIMVRFVPMIHK